jgi:hypothetical protein
MEKKWSDLEIKIAGFLSTDKELSHLESPMFLHVARRMLTSFSVVPRPEKGDQVRIVVCDWCNKASCWQGKFMCEEAPHSGVKHLTVGQLKVLALESEEYWGLKRTPLVEAVEP